MHGLNFQSKTLEPNLRAQPSQPNMLPMLDVPYKVLYGDSKPTTDICIGEVAIGVAGSSAS